MKVSGLQIFWIILTFISGNSLLLTVQPSISAAKQDAWISYLIACIFGIIIVYIAVRVALLYPNHSFVQYSKLILGKWMGTIIVVIYLIQWYSALGNILGEFAEFTNTILLSKTPPWILVLTMLLLIIYLTFIGGIEGIGRCSEVFGPIILGSTLLIILITIPDMQFNRILPIYQDSGMIQIVNETKYPFSFFAESVFMLMLLSFMDKENQGRSWAIWGVTITALLISLATLCVIFVFGPEVASKLKFPAFDMIRYINVMNFIQNLEIIAVLVWILSVFIKLSLYFFLACYCTAELFKLKDWRKTIWFVAVFSYIWTQFLLKYSLHGYHYLDKYWTDFIIPINMIGIPLLLWIVGTIRKKRNDKKQNNLQTNSQA